MTVLLVLVHPGSLCGSAAAQLGKMDARAAREEILMEVAQHEGGLLVIDGCLSDELSQDEQQMIEAALDRAAARGALAARLWGCDAGEEPFDAWRGRALADGTSITDHQDTAAAAAAVHISAPEIIVTGAWATPDHSSGCASSVLLALREALGEKAVVRMSPSALEEPDEFDEDLEEDEDSLAC